MEIPVGYTRRYLYHFTHIDNLASLLRTGLLSKNDYRFPAEDTRSIAEQTIQERRAAMVVPCGNGGVVHDYVPFYFGSLSLMLLGVINKKNIDQQDILYFEFPINLLMRKGAVFTNASANTAGAPVFYDDLSKLDSLNWDEIDSLKWSCANDKLRHERMAEALIPGPIYLNEAARVIVWNDETKSRVVDIGAKEGRELPPISFEFRERRHFFVKFGGADANQSLVMGPGEINSLFESAYKAATAIVQPNAHARHRNLKALLMNLDRDLSCLPHTKELIGLRSENGVHKLTVDKHTIAVVEKLVNSDEYKELTDAQQGLVRLAAYLHDIGKGPKARWDWNNGLQKNDPDHPAKAMAMMVDIFEKHVASFKISSARRLLKLVCYHDLFGEIIGKGRDEQQLFCVVEDLADLDMLLALGKADSTSLSDIWWNQEAADELYKRCLQRLQ